MHDFIQVQRFRLRFRIKFRIMGLKKYFVGKTGFVFWLNVVLAAIVLICIPVLVFDSLDAYTNHGDKVSVPSIEGKSAYEAERILSSNGLVAVISDSTYKKSAKPGTVLDQNPKSGNMVKPGRLIYMTVNLFGEPLAKLPDLAHNSSLREAEIKLRAIGFKLTQPKYVPGQYKDQVLMIKQGRREVHGGDMISKERALTLYVGAGEEDEDTIVFDDETVRDPNSENDLDEHESNFDVQL